MPRRRQPADALEVQRVMCATCIFRESHWKPEKLAQLLDDVRDRRMDGFFTGYRICHHSKTAVCAGLWARYKDNFALGQIAQRLGFVRLVDHDTLDIGKP